MFIPISNPFFRPGQAFPPIDTLEKVKEEQKLLELLDDICRGAQVIDEAQRSTGRSDYRLLISPKLQG